MKIQKVLIANRSEIAIRIIKTCKRLKIKTVSIYSDADSESPFVKFADESFYIGESPSTESYLNIEKIISIAKQNSVDAIHPGYGFLSENSEFAKKVIEAGIIFIGPSSETIALMGDKIQSRIHADKNNIPIIPGYDGESQNPDELLVQSEKIGFPVIIKASAGGGGKGMKRVDSKEDFFDSLDSAKREAKNFFGNDKVFIEKFIQDPRHIEIQIFGDSHGNIFPLLERDCSVQRRHQKIIEECPAPNFSESLRKKMSDTAVLIGKSISYLGAGTVEFILDKNDNFYFMEMNTRLQVEHTVTEMVTGLDLVELQIKVANGESLDLKLESPDKHSIEVRVYAEDPENQFLPSIGKIKFLTEPKNIRIDSGVETNSTVSIFYDPMISKIISVGSTRNEAIQNLQTALDDYILFGLTTNISYLKFLLNQKIFIEGKFTTSYIDNQLRNFKNSVEINQAICFAYLFFNSEIITNSIHDAILKSNSTVVKFNENKSLDFKLKFKQDIYSIAFIEKNKDLYKFKIQVNLIPNEIEIKINETLRYENNVLSYKDEIYFLANGYNLYLYFKGNVYNFQIQSENISEIQNNSNQYTSPMPGKLTKLFVKQNDKILKGDLLAIVEAMKMENPIKANRDSTIKEIFKEEGSILASEEIIFTVF